MGEAQLMILDELDEAKTQCYHFTAIIIAGMGFFTDAYDLFCISLVTKLLGRIYYTVEGAEGPGTLPPGMTVVVNSVAFCGTLTGQLFFGWLGDKMGRKRVYGITLALMFVCSIGSGLSLGTTPRSVMATLCFFRFWLGFGIGGDYPLSATIMSEYANKKTRGAFIAAVFAMQGFGILAGGLFALTVSASYNAMFPTLSYKDGGVASTAPEADCVWRIIVMAGAVPAALTFYWRMKMPETARYTALVANDAARAAADMARVLEVEMDNDKHKIIDEIPQKRSSSFGLFSREFLHRHGIHLLGTTTTWFLVDFAFYSQNLFQKDIFTAVGWMPKPETMNALEEVYLIARAQTLIALFSTVPGYWFTVFFVDKIGRFTIQMMGFLFMTLFMLVLVLPYRYWTQENPFGFVVLYSLTFFFANFGPNTTTFILPAEIFPTRLRTTCHGISAASGKLGAIVGAFAFMPLTETMDKMNADPRYSPEINVQNSLLVFALVTFLGMLFTFLVPETKGLSLEEISGECEDQNGDTELGDHEQASYNSTVPF